MEIRPYDPTTDEGPLMALIAAEGWPYADEGQAELYSQSLARSITFVAVEGDVLCGYSRSLEDYGLYVYVCDLLVAAAYRGRSLGRQLMECIYTAYPRHTVYVMSDVDGYYEKQAYTRVGSVFQVPDSR